MMGLFRIGVGIFIVSLSSVTAWATTLEDKNTLREKGEQLCYNDVQRLCNDAIPDEDKVKACMQAKRSQLSPPCLKIFDEGMGKS